MTPADKERARDVIRRSLGKNWGKEQGIWSDEYLILRDSIAAALAAERERAAQWHEAKADASEAAEADLPAIRREHCRILAAQHRNYAAAIRAGSAS